LFLLSSAAFVVFQLLTVLDVDKSKFTSTSYNYNSTEMANISMQEFTGSFSFIIGTKNETLDWFDNPYVSPNVYITTQDALLPTDIKLKKCSQKELD